MTDFNALTLTTEQKTLIEYGLAGHNVMCNACIGSGKTTTIQKLCMELPKDKKILYLTFNASLKLDAKRKIILKNKSSLVQNYHGFAYGICKSKGLKPNRNNSIELLLKNNLPIPNYEVLIIDEYQDISVESSKLLLKIKETNPSIQIIVVGDMDQRIYDRNNLDVLTFFKKFIGKHKEIYLTTCFRLNSSYANEIGIAWNKQINGTNEKCKILCMEKNEIVSFLSTQNPNDVLVLGKNNYGTRSEIQNELEKKYPEIYNKKTLYASITDDNETCNTQQGKKSKNENYALFITYDKCKGLERDTCIICDFESSYWVSRTSKTNAKYEIMKNLFLVAITRGKKNIIFCKPEKMYKSDKIPKRPYPYSVIDEIKIPTSTNKIINDLTASAMYDFRYKENIDELYSELIITEIPQKNQTEIVCKNKEALIDLSPCVGEYQEFIYFEDYDINKEVNLLKDDQKKLYKIRNTFKKITDKILLFTAIETGQERYISQTQGIRFFEENEETKLIERLSTHLSKNSKHQITMEPIKIEYGNGEQFFIRGVADVQKGNTIYELKYVDEPKKEHFLQLATYMLGLHKSKGVLWNTRKNQYYEVKIKNKKNFVNKIVQAVSNDNYNKGKLKK